MDQRQRLVYSDRRVLPRAPALPLVGSLPHILSKRLSFFTDTRRRCGDVYFLRLGPLEMIVCNHPDHVRQILVDNERAYVKEGPFWETLRNALGNGLPVSQGEFWQRQRRMMARQFSRAYLLALTEMIVDAIDDVIATWDVGATDTPVNITRVAPQVSLNVLTHTIFGGRLSPKDVSTLSDAIPAIIEGLLSGMLAVGLPPWIYFLGKKRVRKAIVEAEAVAFRTIAACRQMKATDGSLLSLLVHAVDDETNERMTDRQLRDEVITLFVSGYDIVATALSWIFDLLTQHPAVCRKLQVEVDAVLAGRRPGAADLQKLEYTEMVLKESLRMYPPIYWFTRMAQEEDVLGGVPIHTGTTVALMSYAIHHHPDFWEEPFTFDPERFSPERSVNRHEMAWLPFGMGPHGCIAKELAMMEMKLLLACVLQRFDLTAKKSRLTKPKMSSILKPADSVVVLLKQRQPVVHDTPPLF